MCHIILITESCLRKLFCWMSNQSTTSSVVHKRTIESRTERRSCSTRPVLSLYNRCLQHTNTTNSWTQLNMKTFNLCILLSLGVAVYCVPIQQVTVQDEDFAEVCVLYLYGIKVHVETLMFKEFWKFISEYIL